MPEANRPLPFKPSVQGLPAFGWIIAAALRASGVFRKSKCRIRAMSSSYLPGLMALTMAAVCCSARAETIPVTIKGLAFLPAQTHASIGDTIEWINQDFVAHTATARNGDWDVVIAAHKSARQILAKAGTIEYYCRFHPNMKATITIAPK